MTISVNQAQNNQNPSRRAAGVAVGLAIGLPPFALMANNILSVPSDKKIEKMKTKIPYLLTEIDSFENIKKYADDIVVKENKRGHKIGLKIVTPATIDEILPLKEPKNFVEKMFYKVRSRNRKLFVNGLNAFYSIKKKTANVNDKMLYSAVFHEIGHGINRHSKNTKIIAKIRPYAQLALPFIALSCLGVGVFTHKKKPEEKSKHKFLDFIHNNAGKIIFACSLPIIGDEALASLNGFKIAKNYLTEAQHELHVQNQAKALASYIVPMVGLSAIVSLGIYVKDRISQGKRQSS